MAKNKTKAAKLFVKGKAVKKEAVDKAVDKVFFGIDAKDYALERTTTPRQQFGVFQTLTFEGYEFNGSAEVLSCKKTGGAISSRYAKVALLFTDSKIVYYSNSRSLIDETGGEVYAEFAYQDVRSIAIHNETVKIKRDPKHEDEKTQYVFAEFQYMAINAGETFILPLDGVKSFADRPVLDELRKFIEAKKSL